MFNIACHWESAKPSHDEILPPTYQNTGKMATKLNADENTKKWDRSDTAAECRMTLPLWKAVRQLLKRQNEHVPCSLAVAFLSIYSREKKNSVHRQIRASTGAASSFVHSPKPKTTQMFLNGWTVQRPRRGILAGERKSPSQTHNHLGVSPGPSDERKGLMSNG